MTITCMEDTIALLLANCLPGGHTAQRLLKIRGQIERNVMVGPKSRAFIAELHEKLDNIECEFLLHNGICRKLNLPQCPHLEKFKECPKYRANRPIRTRDPLTIGGKG